MGTDNELMVAGVMLGLMFLIAKRTREFLLARRMRRARHAVVQEQRLQLALEGMQRAEREAIKLWQQLVEKRQAHSDELANVCTRQRAFVDKIKATHRMENVLRQAAEEHLTERLKELQRCVAELQAENDRLVTECGERIAAMSEELALEREKCLALKKALSWYDSQALAFAGEGGRVVTDMSALGGVSASDEPS